MVSPVNGLLENVDVKRGDSFANFGRDDGDFRLEFSMIPNFFYCISITFYKKFSSMLFGTS